MLNRFRNNNKLVTAGDLGWEQAEKAGLLNVHARYNAEGKLIDENGHEFINMVSCSYLGLDVDKRILEGAKQAIDDMGTLIMGSARIRVSTTILKQTEDKLSEVFDSYVLTNVSTGVTTCGVLPFVSSGHITDTEPLVTVFDKHAHFCLNLAKPICADEGEVLTSPHNDLNYLEDVCKKHPRVAYVCDGIYSTGDHAPIKNLLELQNKYGLFLFIDDSHGISVYGKQGAGYARSLMSEVGPRTMIVGSLAKAFGARGSVLMLGAKNKANMIKRYGGGIGWSQCLLTPDCGAILASAKIHQSPEISVLQQKLQANIKLADETLPVLQKGETFPIRIIRLGDISRAVTQSKKIFADGYFASAVFFPVVEKGKAGLRVMLRADLSEADIRGFANSVNAAANV